MKNPPAIVGYISQRTKPVLGTFQLATFDNQRVIMYRGFLNYERQQREEKYLRHIQKQHPTASRTDIKPQLNRKGQLAQRWPGDFQAK